MGWVCCEHGDYDGSECPSCCEAEREMMAQEVASLEDQVAGFTRELQAAKLKIESLTYEYTEVCAAIGLQPAGLELVLAHAKRLVTDRDEARAGTRYLFVRFLNALGGEVARDEEPDDTVRRIRLQRDKAQHLITAYQCRAREALSRSSSEPDLMAHVLEDIIVGGADACTKEHPCRTCEVSGVLRDLWRKAKAEGVNCPYCGTRKCGDECKLGRQVMEDR